MNRDIRTRVLFLALAPATLSAVLVAAYLTKAWIQDLEQSWADRGQTIANQLALACEFGGLIADRASLNALASSTLQEAEVVRVMIQDGNGKALVEVSSPRPGAAQDPTLATSVLFKAPIHPTGIVPHPDHSSLVPTGTSGTVGLELSRESLAHRQRAAITTGVMLTLGGLLLAAVMAPLIGRKVSTLILRLEDIIQTHHKQFQEQVDEATAELRETLEELEIKNVELDIARKKAVQANRVKSEFLANMSHEIRTPMNGVMGFIALLSKTRLDRTQQGYLQTLRASAENLMVILNDILDFSKIEAGKFKIRQRNFDLREVLENAVLLFAANAHYKGLNLILDIEPDVPSNLVGDAPRIVQIVTNFVSNAIKFTEHGEIEVQVSKTYESAQAITMHLKVRDTGIGIAPADQQRLFKAFDQLDTSTTRRHSGTGLGLAICQRLVNLMNGQVRVESQPGAGTTFYVSLSVDKQTDAPTDPPPLANTSILVVSRDALLTRAVIHILEFGGAQPYHAPDLAAAAVSIEGSLGATGALRGIILDLDERQHIPEALLKVSRERGLGQYCALILMGTDEEHPRTDGLSSVFPTLYFAHKPPTSRELLSLLAIRPPSPGQPDSAGQTFEEAYIPPPATVVKARVLLADDNLINRQLARIFLNQLGAQVDEAGTGLEAVESCHRHRYDLIFMDIHMPEMDGLEATRRIRLLEDNPNSHIPIIALTADAMNRKRAQYLEVGMNDHLSKPITEAALQRILEKWCTGHRVSLDQPAKSSEDTL